MGFSRFMEKKRVDTPLPWNHLEHEDVTVRFESGLENRYFTHTS